ncbi:hypothetical protein LDENG_00136960, partial [Lucifuga dentata]
TYTHTYIHIYVHKNNHNQNNKTKRHNQEDQVHIYYSMLLYFSSTFFFNFLKLIHSCTLFNFII